MDEYMIRLLEANPDNYQVQQMALQNYLQSAQAQAEAEQQQVLLNQLMGGQQVQQPMTAYDVQDYSQLDWGYPGQQEDIAIEVPDQPTGLGGVGGIGGAILQTNPITSFANTAGAGASFAGGGARGGIEYLQRNRPLGLYQAANLASRGLLGANISEIDPSKMQYGGVTGMMQQALGEQPSRGAVSQLSNLAQKAGIPTDDIMNKMKEKFAGMMGTRQRLGQYLTS